MTFVAVGCRQQKHPFERVATPYQVHSWMAPPLDHNVDYIRAEDGRLLDILQSVSFSLVEKSVSPSCACTEVQLFCASTAHVSPWFKE